MYRLKDVSHNRNRLGRPGDAKFVLPQVLPPVACHHQLLVFQFEPTSVLTSIQRGPELPLGQVTQLHGGRQWKDSPGGLFNLVNQQVVDNSIPFSPMF